MDLNKETNTVENLAAALASASDPHRKLSGPLTATFSVLNVPHPEKLGLVKALLLAGAGQTVVIQCATPQDVEDITIRFENILDLRIETDRYPIGNQLNFPSPNANQNGKILLVDAAFLNAITNNIADRRERNKKAEIKAMIQQIKQTISTLIAQHD
jgi:hypothetical protein